MKALGQSRRRFGEQERFMLLLIAPAALLMALFQVVPIVIGANASFRDWALNNPKKTWVGLSHYTDVITDPAFLQVVLPNTFLFMALSVGGALVIGLCLALVFNRGFRGQKLVQTMLLLPLMVAPVTLSGRSAILTFTSSLKWLASKANRGWHNAGARLESYCLPTSGSGRRGSCCCCLPVCNPFPRSHSRRRRLTAQRRGGCFAT